MLHLRFEGYKFFLFCSYMTMAKGLSHKQELFDSIIFSRQNWGIREFYTNTYKSSAHPYFWEIWLSLTIFS